MGKIITLSPKEIFPTQKHLVGTQVASIVRAYLDQDLVPFPVVRYITGLYVTVDGHHRIAANDLLNRDVKVYKPNNADDLMTTQEFSEYSQDFCDRTNYIISWRYSTKKKDCNLLYGVKLVRSERIFSFKDLRSRQEGLESMETLSKHYPEYFI